MEVSIFQPEEKAEGFLCYFAIFELTVKTRAQQDLTQGAGDQVKHSPQALPLAKKSHFNSSHELFSAALDSVAPALVDAQLYFVLKQH